MRQVLTVHLRDVTKKILHEAFRLIKRVLKKAVTDILGITASPALEMVVKCTKEVSPLEKRRGNRIIYCRHLLHMSIKIPTKKT